MCSSDLQLQKENEQRLDIEVKLEVKDRIAREAVQIEKIRSEFFANLSHEFKTPITIIMAAIYMLDQIDATNQEELVDARKYVKGIKQNSYRLLRLVNNLIDVTKIDAGFYTLQKHNYNIVYVVEEIVLSVVEYAKEQSLEILFDTEIEEEIIACDPDKIERILLNLLSNAIKYTQKGGCIQVDIKKEKEEVVILVQDNGIGIAAEKLPPDVKSVLLQEEF